MSVDNGVTFHGCLVSLKSCIEAARKNLYEYKLLSITLSHLSNMEFCSFREEAGGSRPSQLKAESGRIHEEKYSGW